MTIPRTGEISEPATQQPSAKAKEARSPGRKSEQAAKAATARTAPSTAKQTILEAVAGVLQPIIEKVVSHKVKCPYCGVYCTSGSSPRNKISGETEPGKIRYVYCPKPECDFSWKIPRPKTYSTEKKPVYDQASYGGEPSIE